VKTAASNKVVLGLSVAFFALTLATFIRNVGDPNAVQAFSESECMGCSVGETCEHDFGPCDWEPTHNWYMCAAYYCNFAPNPQECMAGVFGYCTMGASSCYQLACP